MSSSLPITGKAWRWRLEGMSPTGAALRPQRSTRPLKSSGITRHRAPPLNPKTSPNPSGSARPAPSRPTNTTKPNVHSGFPDGNSRTLMRPVHAFPPWRDLAALLLAEEHAISIGTPAGKRRVPTGRNLVVYDAGSTLSQAMDLTLLNRAWNACCVPQNGQPRRQRRECFRMLLQHAPKETLTNHKEPNVCSGHLGPSSAQESGCATSLSRKTTRVPALFLKVPPKKSDAKSSLALNANPLYCAGVDAVRLTAAWRLQEHSPPSKCKSDPRPGLERSVACRRATRSSVRQCARRLPGQSAAEDRFAKDNCRR